MTALLREATPQELPVRDAITHAAWGLSLTVAQYQERETCLRAHAFSRAGMTSWRWAEGERVLASCETFRMRSRLAGEEGATYGVASVYTEEALRRRGHATAMIDALAPALLERDARAQAIILFSDVGEAQYARSGFALRPSLDRVFEPQAGDPAEGVDALFGDAALAAQWAQVRFPEARFLVVPSAEQLDWHLERERTYARLLWRPRPVACGARVGRSRAFWVGNLRSRELYLLWLDAGSAEDAVALLRCARRVAHGAGLEKVVLWECPVPFSWPSGADGGAFGPRAESLVMIRPLVEGLEPGDFQHAPRALWI